MPQVRKSFELTTIIGDPNDKNGVPVVGDVYVVGSGGPDRLERHQIALTGTAWVGTLTLVSRKRGSSSAFQAIPYTGRNVNAAVGTDASVNTPITASSTIEVNADGFEYGFQVTAYTSGTMLVEVALTVAA